MQIAVRRKTKPERRRRNETRQILEDHSLKEFASMIARIVTESTYAGVQSLKVNLEPTRVILTGICESFYIKQLAQQSIMGLVNDREIVNDIAVI